MECDRDETGTRQGQGGRGRQLGAWVLLMYVSPPSLPSLGVGAVVDLSPTSILFVTVYLASHNPRFPQNIRFNKI